MKTILLILTTINLLASPRGYIKDVCRNIDSKIEKRSFSISYNSLNAFDRAKVKVSYQKKIEKITDQFHILKFKSSEFKLGDYDFNLEAYPIVEIKTKDLEIKLIKPLFLRVSNKEAQMIAAKKEFGTLNLYVKIKFNIEKKEFANKYCNKKEITLEPLIYEYSLNCSLTGKFFGYEKIKYNEKQKLVSVQLDGVDKDHINFIKKNLTILNENIEKCHKTHKGSGIKFYTLEISKEKILVNTGSQTKISPELEKCLDNQIKKYNYPILKNKKYKVYFSIVLPNL